MLKSKPVSAGEMDAPTERAIAVTPDAAERSSGGLKIIYDLLLYREFRAVKPPEEI